MRGNDAQHSLAELQIDINRPARLMPGDRQIDRPAAEHR